MIKLSNIQIEDPSATLNFDVLSDSNSGDDKEPEVVTVIINVNGDNDQGAGGGNIGNSGDTTVTGETSSSQTVNNSGGENEGSTSHSQHHNVFRGESSRSNLPRQVIWKRAHPYELIVGDPNVGVRTRSATQMNVNIQGFFLKRNQRELRKH